MGGHSGSNIAKLGKLAIALVPNAISGKDELIQSNLSGRKNIGCMNHVKSDEPTRLPAM